MSFWKKFSDALHRMNYPDVAASKAAHPSNYTPSESERLEKLKRVGEMKRFSEETTTDHHSRDHMYGNGRGGYRIPHHPVIDEPTHPEDFTSLDSEARELCSLGESWSADAPKMAGVSQPEEEPDQESDLPHGGADLLDRDDDEDYDEDLFYYDEDEEDLFYYDEDEEDLFDYVDEDEEDDK